jgi:hypothetical protein
MTNFRIGHPDKRNWTIEQFVQGGSHPITKKRGPDKWEIIGYYGSPEDVAKYVLRHQIELPDGTLQNQIQDLLTEIERAEKSILEQLKKTYDEKENYDNI